MTKEILNQMSEYFFNTKINIKIKNVEIPPSHILDKIAEIKLEFDESKQFEQFSMQVKKIVKEYAVN